MNFFHINLEALKRSAPPLALKLESLPPPPAAEKTRGSGISAKLGDVRLASSVDPVAEGVKFARSAKLEDVPHILVYGLGLAYHIEAIIAEHPRIKRIAVIEANPHILSLALHHRDLASILSDGRFSLITGDSDREISMRLGELLGKDDDWELLIHQPSYRCLPEDFREIRNIFETILSERRFKTSFGEQEKRNIFENLGAISSSPGASTLFNSLRGKPAILAGAGPSLDRNLPLLRYLAGKVFILAADTAAQALSDHGIPFNAVISVDPQPLSAQFFTFPPEGAPLIFLPTTHPWIVGRYSGNRYLVIKKSHPVFGDAEHLFEEKEFTTAGGSASCIGLDILAKAGANPIGVMGQDFSFVNGRPYNRSTLSFMFPDIYMKTPGEGFSNHIYSSGMLQLESIHSRALSSHANLVGYLRNFETIIAAGKDIAFYNINSSGAPIRGCRNIASAGEAYENLCRGAGPVSPLPVCLENENPTLSARLKEELFR